MSYLLQRMSYLQRSLVMYIGKFHLFARFLMTYYCRLQRRDMVEGLETHRRTQAENMLILLVESGIVFGIFQVCYSARSSFVR